MIICICFEKGSDNIFFLFHKIFSFDFTLIFNENFVCRKTKPAAFGTTSRESTHGVSTILFKTVSNIGITFLQLTDLLYSCSIFSNFL